MRILPQEVTALYASARDPLPAILAAEALLAQVLIPAGVTEAQLCLLEPWLAAHFLSVSDGGVVSGLKLGATEVRFTAPTSRVTGTGLASTPYGQVALTLDPTGLLADLGLKAASIDIY